MKRKLRHFVIQRRTSNSKIKYAETIINILTEKLYLENSMLFLYQKYLVNNFLIRFAGVNIFVCRLVGVCNKTS